MKQNISFLGQGSENNCVVRPEQLSSPNTLLVECCLGSHTQCGHQSWFGNLPYNSSVRTLPDSSQWESALQFIFKSLAKFFATCFRMSHHYWGNLASTQVLESLLQNNVGWQKQKLVHQHASLWSRVGIVPEHTSHR
jgi:hypothetical protein